ncbi:polyadenylate-binding protein-interacting protein 6 [Carex littledalei]|uniref:Polyadenylate-binding protein-interacting protein 6 n=1 Tax=Carex littledalei TaxID=544730 RepID=A0A833VSI9_9POAL|nr:polyadenylate-binding protein-interacting protein 6 [Carex littledalei]
MGNVWAIFELLNLANYRRTDRMLDSKSFLNPNASPYIPISKLSSNDGTKSTKCPFNDSNPSEDSLQRLENHDENTKPNEDFGLQKLENLDLAPECFSNLVISENFEDIFHADICTPDQPNLIIESLGLMFPSTSMECIEEVLKLNHFDLGQTLTMLDELEDNDFDDCSQIDNPK